MEEKILSSKDKFPYHYRFIKLGGAQTEEGEEYFLKYEKELNKEYDFYWKESIERLRFGGTEKVHKIKNDE